MRKVVNGKRTRGRSGRNKPSNPRNQTYDSSGPEGKVRGSANQVYEKYLALARDSQTSGDRIGAENFFQHAEHFFRIMSVTTQNDRNRPQANGAGQVDAASGRGNGRSASQSRDPVAEKSGAAVEVQQPEATQPPPLEAEPTASSQPSSKDGGDLDSTASSQPSSKDGGDPDNTAPETPES